jgi:serine/alanine adding enzyme
MGDSEPVDKRWVRVEDDQGQWEMPLILTRLRGGGYDAASPYGYSGIHISEALGPEQRERAWNTTLDALRDLGVVSLFLRFAPFEEGNRTRAASLATLDMVHLSDTIAVPTNDADDVWTAMQGRARTAVRKAQKAGMTASVEPASMASMSEGGDFRVLYDSTMERLEAASHHRYNDSYYSQLSETLGENLQLVVVRASSGQPVAASLLMIDDSVVHYHLSGSDPAAARDGANNLLLWSILEWSAANGHPRVHLGGGTSAMDSLYKFKLAFGGSAHPYFVGRAVVNKGRYDKLVEERAGELGIEVAKLRESSHFPLYRAGA